MGVYIQVATAPMPGFDSDGNPITLPAGTVINIVEWDGTTTFPQPSGVEIRLYTDIGIGGTVAL